VGTTITTPAESDRRTERDVVIAAGKRLSEALRCIEEYGKLIDPDFAARIEALRYRGYTIESQLHKLIGSDRVCQWHLCVLVSESLCTGRPWDEVVAGAIAGGADCIQVREKTLPDGELLLRVEHVIELARAARHAVSVIVNDRADIALAAGADGVHLGQDDLPPDRVRQIVGRALCIGVSTHNLTEAKRAVRAGSDYCGVGAMFTTSTKPRRTSGIAYLQRFLSKYPHLPHLAIGGIHAGNAVEVLEAGAQGLAVSSTICGADDPARETRRLVRLIERHVRSES
jgi:thiamine-phosphate pyrophosphorylase